MGTAVLGTAQLYIQQRPPTQQPAKPASSSLPGWLPGCLPPAPSSEEGKSPHRCASAPLLCAHSPRNGGGSAATAACPGNCDAPGVKGGPVDRVSMQRDIADAELPSQIASEDSSPKRRGLRYLARLSSLAGCVSFAAGQGCTDPLADNALANTTAVSDDGSCVYSCAALGANAWNGTLGHANATGAGVDFANANCSILLFPATQPAGSCCDSCCPECCNTPITVFAGGRHIVQGRLRPGHQMVVATAADRAAVAPDGYYQLPVLSRTIFAETGAFVAVRNVKVPAGTPGAWSADATRPSFIYASAGVLVVEESYFDGNNGYSAGTITMKHGGEVRIGRSYFKYCTALPGHAESISSAGAASLPNGGTLHVEWSAFVSCEGQAGGVFYSGTGVASITTIVSSLFVSNTVAGTGWGGAISSPLEAALLVSDPLRQLTLRQSTFENNRPGNPNAGGGGDVWQNGGHLTIIDCVFSPFLLTAVPNGQSLAVRELLTWSIRSTTFNAYQPCGGQSAISGGCSVYTRSSPPLGCHETPCQPGFSCSFMQLSTWCTACSWPLVSTDGLTCSLCPAGKGPTTNLSACEDCVAGTVSSHGVCQVCRPGTQPFDNKTGCENCTLNFVSAQGLGCYSCDPGFQSNPLQSACDHCGAFGSASYSLDGSPCINCSAGRSPNVNRSQCVDCPAGLHSPDGSPCTRCQAGWEPSLRLFASICQQCNSSSFSCDGSLCRICDDGNEPVQNNTACKPCPSARAGVNGVCSPCAAGHQPSWNRTMCLPCAQWYENNTYSVAGSECVPCESGKQPNVHRTNCEYCPAGKYSSVGICEVCDAGYEPVASLGSTGCQSCAFVGAAFASTSGAQCSPCSPGSQPNANRTSCIQCSTLADNVFSPDGASCDTCMPGYAVDSARLACTECSPGQHSSNGSSCESCAQYSLASYSTAAASHCWDCSPGSSPQADRSGCQDCQPGLYSADGTPCISCKPGHEPNENRTECQQCNSTAISIPVFPGSGTTCQACPAGKQPENTTSCASCPAGTAGGSGSCLFCSPGKQPSPNKHQCELCSAVAGANTVSEDGVLCSPCSAGTAPNNVNTFCATCAPGFYSAEGALSCSVCDLGSEPNVILFGHGATHCVPCVAGASTLGGQCDTCPPGSEPNTAGTGCTICTSGKYSADGSNCSACNPGWEPQQATASTSCVPCLASISNGTQCYTCPAGYQPSQPFGASTCQHCSEIGPNAFSPAGIICTSCVPGSAVSTDRSACIPCVTTAGLYSTDGATCVQCPPGSQPGTTGQSCVNCATVGAEYFSATGQACTVCSPGTQPSTSRDSCTPCSSLGDAMVSSAGGPCQQCLEGYEPAPDRSTCLPCAVGKVSAGGSTCIDCLEGSSPNSAKTHCYACENSVSNQQTAFQCTQCAQGQYVANSSSLCSECPTGKVSSNGIECFSCGPGHAPDANKIYCIQCPFGKYSSHGQFCMSCLPGSQPNLPVAATFCQSCDSISQAHYNSDGISCTVCPPGFQRNINGTGCVHCASIGPGLVSTTGLCSVCPNGSQPNVARTLCTACFGVDRISPDGHACIQCPPGWLANSLKTECVPCTWSEYMTVATTGICSAVLGPILPLAGSAACEVCANNASLADPVYCRTCAVGSEVTPTGCSYCSPGTVSPDGISCISCPTGRHANSARSACETCSLDQYFDMVSLACDSCGPGYEVTVDRLECTLCPAGRYSDDNFECKLCLPGTEPDSARVSCRMCPTNFISVNGLRCELCPDGLRSSLGATECIENDQLSPELASVLILFSFCAGVAAAIIFICWYFGAGTGRSLVSNSSTETPETVENNPLADSKSNVGVFDNEPRTNARPIDLVFVVGCSTSMSIWLQTVSHSISSTIKILHERYGHGIRLGFVGFRDYGVSAGRRFELADLTDDFDALQLFIYSAEPDAISAVPTDVTGALEQCGNLQWRYATRIAVVLTDSPCHGSRFHSISDRFPRGDPSGLEPEQIMQNLALEGTHVYFGKISNSTDRMFRLLQSAYENVQSCGAKCSVINVGSSNGPVQQQFEQAIIETVSRAVRCTMRYQHETATHRQNQRALPHLATRKMWSTAAPAPSLVSRESESRGSSNTTVMI